MWFTYFLFVYNAVVGLVSALLRVLISATLGLLLMLRLDRVILMKGFEIMDLGTQHCMAISTVHKGVEFHNVWCFKILWVSGEARLPTLQLHVQYTALMCSFAKPQTPQGVFDALDKQFL